MSNPLEVLREHQEDILLAEVAAWLHDMGKCTDEFIQHEEARGFRATRSSVKSARLNPHKAIFKVSELSRFSFSSDRLPERGEEAESRHALHRLLGEEILSLLDEKTSLLGSQYSLRELIYFGRPGFAGRTSQPLGKDGTPADYLGRCHGAAHVEKEETDKAGKQHQDDSRLSDALGREFSSLTGLTGRLKGLPFTSITDRDTFQHAVKEAFVEAPGDTRRPENEVTLWDWSHIVAALYKAALAGALLGYQPEPNKLCWRLLSMRVDGSAFLERVSGIPDLLSRQALLDDAFKRIRVLLEATYPLGTCVYHDQNGGIYVVPNIELLLELPNAEGKTLKELIDIEFAKGTIDSKKNSALSGEIYCCVQLDSKAWQAQRPDRSFDVPPIGSILRTQPLTCADPEQVTRWWQKGTADVCIVCGLRPQGPGPKARKRNVCDICEQRRADRSKIWAKGVGVNGHLPLPTTIWTDEVVDNKGRLALIVGQFDLTHWLDGSFIHTLAVIDPDPADASDKTADAVAKNPSFARIRRVWETTHAFWQPALREPGADGQPVLQPVGRRLEIVPKDRDRLNLGLFHTYELVLGQARLSIVWDSDNHRFITCDNLKYLAKPEQLGRDVEEWLKEHQCQGRLLTLEEPGGYGSKNKVWGTIIVERVNELPCTYTPAIPILAEPRTFMALVPADKALAIARAIKEKYEREMGKVRNRLPLHLGLVFFPRKQPLRAVLEAGRAMLDGFAQPTPEEREPWEVTGVCEFPDHLPERFEHDPHFRRGRTLELACGDRRLRWHVPLAMGDGKTKDVWYPYVFIAADEAKLQDRRRKFKGCRPTGQDGKTEPCWLVHAAELRKGDRVYISPARFDFEFLDTTARRFEVSYHDGKRRAPAKRNRPYLLDDLGRFADLWQTLCGLSTSQIKALDGLIEAKRESWRQGTGNEEDKEYDKVFARFVCDALKTAGWKRKPEDWETLYQAALTGELHDVVELYMEILKRRPEQERQQTKEDAS